MNPKEFQEWAQIFLGVATTVVVVWTKIRNGVGFKLLKASIDDLTKKDQIKQLVHQKLEYISIEKLKYLMNFNANYKVLLGSWSEKFEDFAIDAYFSQYRKTPDIENYLNSKMGVLLGYIETSLLDRVQGTKNGKSIIDFANNKGELYRETDILVRTLIKNGLTDDQYIRLFEDSLTRVLNEGINLLQEWDESKELKTQMQ